MSRPEIKTAVKGHVLGEGPHWSEKDQELLYVDIQEKSIHRYVPSTGQHYQVTLDASPTIVIPVDGHENKFLVAMETELKLMEWDKTSGKATSVKTLDGIEQEKDLKIKFVDGKCDPQGRLWVGSAGSDMGGNFVSKKGKLYNFGPALKSHVDNVGLSNGLAWSSDSSNFFYVDSFAYTVDVFDFDSQQGTLKNRRVLYDLKKNGTKGLPDGMTIDSQNNLWVASFMGAAVLHIDTTTGTLIDKIDFRDHTSNITSVAFGGPNLDTLYVTSCSLSFPEIVPDSVGAAEIDGGSLFQVTNLGVKGVTGGVNYKGLLP